MPRNLGGRVELLFPVEDQSLLRALRDDVLFLHLRDNVQARILNADGTYTRATPEPNEPPIDSQALRLAARGSRHEDE